MIQVFLKNKSMLKKIFQILIAMIFIFSNTLKAQTSVTIPAYTAYAIPAEQSMEESESNMFSKQSGIQNWTDSKQNIQFFFNHCLITGTIHVF